MFVEHEVPMSASQPMNPVSGGAQQMNPGQQSGSTNGAHPSYSPRQTPPSLNVPLEELPVLLLVPLLPDVLVPVLDSEELEELEFDELDELKPEELELLVDDDDVELEL